MNVTVLLRAWSAGDRAALDELLPQVHAALRRLAARHMRGQAAGHTFTPTDLVSEAYLRLVGAESSDFSDRVHFFAVSARIMRQILVDHARRRAAGKRGGGGRKVTFDEELVGGDRPGELVALDDALEALARFDERKAQIVELCYFAGMSQDEVAAALKVHVNTVARDLRLAKAWIHRYLTESP